MSLCLYCNQQLMNKWGPKTFCNNQCQRNYDYGMYIIRWLSDQVSGYRGGGHVSVYVIKYLKNLRGEVCWECGWNERNKTSGRIPLEIDHIDGNYKNCKKENLRLLCPNCHSLTSTYKNLNKGHGRKLKVLFQEI